MSDRSTSTARGPFSKRSELAFISRIGPQTYFSDSNLRYLVRFFRNLTGGSPNLEKSDFLSMLHETLGYMEHFFMNRDDATAVGNPSSMFLQADQNRDSRIDLEEFVRFMSLVLKGKKEEKIKFCFNCYDLNETKQLTRDVIVTLLAHTGSEAGDRNTDLMLDVLDMILRMMDEDADGVVVFEEFKNSALNDWLLMEAFGQCLPDYDRQMAFLDKMEKNIEIK